MKLFLFTTDIKLARMAEHSGIDSIMVDWEQKTAESEAADGPVDSVDDLERLVKELELPVAVRINWPREDMEQQVSLACKNGAEYIMLPMARTEREVCRFIDLVKGRAKTIVQIETLQLVDRLDAIKSLEWDHAYIGMLDLAAARGEDSIWPMLLDHTVENIISELQGRSVGFGGITITSGGSPVPFTMLLNEMTRLGSTLGFMRRSFKRDIKNREFNTEVTAIRSLIRSSSMRSRQAMQNDYADFVNYISSLVSKKQN